MSDTWKFTTVPPMWPDHLWKLDRTFRSFCDTNQHSGRRYCIQEIVANMHFFYTIDHKKFLAESMCLLANNKHNHKAFTGERLVLRMYSDEVAVSEGPKPDWQALQDHKSLVPAISNAANTLRCQLVDVCWRTCDNVVAVKLSNQLPGGRGLILEFAHSPPLEIMQT